MDCNTPGFPVLHCLLESTQTFVHRVGDATQPSYPLSSPSPPAFRLSQHQGLFQWVSSLHQVAQGLECQSAILVPFDSNQFLLCPWTVSFFQKLCSVPFPFVTLARCHFSLVAFNILPLFKFLSVWSLCILVCSSFGLSFLGDSASRIWLTISFPMLGKFSAITSSNIFSGPFSLLCLGPL